MENERRYAVLIDADNISDKYIKIILEEAAGNGIITYKRIYGDWTNPSHSSWKKVLLDNSIIPMQQYSYTTGKNSTDSAMIIDAMDILYSGTVDGFCLVSSDSDFTRLAARLREAGMQVIGMGESKTPTPFISACNQFKYLDRLYIQQKQEQKEAAALGTKAILEDNKKSADELERVNTTIRSIIENFSDEEGWIFSGRLGDQISKRLPDFDVRNYGYSKLTLFMNSLGDYEINKLTLGNHQKQIYFRIKKKEEKETEQTQEKIVKQVKKTSKKGSGRRNRRTGGRK